jgi:hypothetical protein
MTDPAQIADAETQVFSVEDLIANAETQVFSVEDQIANAETQVLSVEDQIFRPEAEVLRSEPQRVDASQPRPTEAAQASPRWIAWAYWALLVLLAAGLAAGVLIRVGSQPLIVALTAGLFSGAADG